MTCTADALIARGCPADEISEARSGSKNKLTFRHEPKRRDEWDTIRFAAMRFALREKFAGPAARPEVRDALAMPGLADRPVFFVEHVQRDRNWGDGEDGSGTNMLGKMLTELRAGVAPQAPYADATFLATPNFAFVNYGE
jgi:predicted NAD-dependent protein-ADP-ribosyltransferase YbiA (DUF1768 family)